jgi:hypothetical protein
MKLSPEFLEGIDDLLSKAEAISSIMFLGPGITGNRVIGATDERQQALPIDPRTLSIDPNQGIRVRPEHIHLALREFAKIENHPFSQRFPLQVPINEKLHGFWS